MDTQASLVVIFQLNDVGKLVMSLLRTGHGGASRVCCVTGQNQRRLQSRYVITAMSRAATKDSE